MIVFLQFLLDVLEKLHDAPLHHHIQRRGRLIADDDARLEQRRQGDRHPLAHAARQLVGIGIQDFAGVAPTPRCGCLASSNASSFVLPLTWLEMKSW